MTTGKTLETGAAFIARCADEAGSPYMLAMPGGQALYSAVAAGDWLMVVNAAGAVTRIGTLLRVRSTAASTVFYFERLALLDRPVPLGAAVLQSPPAQGLWRLPWDDFIKCVAQTPCACLQEVPLISDRPYLRDLLQLAVADDLLGPANGPYEEIISADVRFRYMVGKLAPPDTRFESEAEDDTLGASVNYDSDEPDDDVDASANLSFVPSSIGFTFCIESAVARISLDATWGRYVRQDSEESDENGKPLKCWKRQPAGGRVEIAVIPGAIARTQVDAAAPDVYILGTVGAALPGDVRLITIFLMNGQVRPSVNQDAAWVFQPELRVFEKDGKAIFRRRPLIDPNGFDEEQQALDMIYRQRVEFAVGHGVSVHATVAADCERAYEVKTSVLPSHEIQETETPGLNAGDRPAMRRLAMDGCLDMRHLASLATPDSRDRLTAELEAITDDYAAWIAENRELIATRMVGYEAPAAAAMARCDTILQRLREGIAVLAGDDTALKAFRFANEAMAAQRVHSIYALKQRRGEKCGLNAIDVAANRSWRPFQLAFILLSIPALADPAHSDRTDPAAAFADLLWFPTGGGKTEAYLGVAAFTMAIRRLQGVVDGFDGGRGLAVIMRYTLRLLTLQQFQRASTLLCAMEVIRRSDPATWGAAPFTIGLWVGNRVTPGTTQDSDTAINQIRDRQFVTGASPAQLTSCPWCGAEIAPGRDIHADCDVGRTYLYCGDKYGRCEFSRSKSPDFGLPVLVVDEEIYRNPPTMLIATVDKFAMMAWRGAVRTLFGKAEAECPRHGLIWPDSPCQGRHNRKGALPATVPRSVTPIRPPDLIIQDEFHLISGPLGTMVALYETTVDDLANWPYHGKTVRPKVIASTATVRKAVEQTRGVFLRQVAVFPPHGLDVEDNFFAVQRPISEKPGRRYMGICAPGSSRPSILIRVYVALLTAAQYLFGHFGAPADPYMTLVGYFSSLRELGGMRRLSEDDVQTRALKVNDGKSARPGLQKRHINVIRELTSRVANKDIPQILDELEIAFKPKWDDGDTWAIDIVLATNMLSVGVDVNRIGLMVVNGQPKNTAEYIQATSRIGRAFPGLVCTVLTWSRPRDLSHYETFEHYHATFYKHVEAKSVTPFAPRALDRGLTGAIISLMRHRSAPLNPNSGAQELTSATDPTACAARQAAAERAAHVKDSQAARLVEAMADDRIKRWVDEAAIKGRLIGYEAARGNNGLVPLLKRPGTLAWDELTVAMSMREVEPPVALIMETQPQATADPPWVAATPKKKGGAK